MTEGLLIVKEKLLSVEDVIDFPFKGKAIVCVDPGTEAERIEGLVENDGETEGR